MYVYCIYVEHPPLCLRKEKLLIIEVNKINHVNYEIIAILFGKHNKNIQFLHQARR